MSSDDDKKSTDKVISRIANSIGAPILGSGTILSDVPGWISTSCRVIDRMLDRYLPPGYCIPYGRITEIHGLEHVGKTTLLSHIFANAQEQDDAICILADTEKTYDKKYAIKLGVKVENIIWLKTTYMEDLFCKVINSLEKIASIAPDRKVVLAWDSLGQTATRAEANIKVDPRTGDLKTPQMMTAATVVNRNIRRINPMLSELSTAFVIINHMYQKPVLFGDPWETYGGRRLKYAASIQLRLMPGKSIKDKNRVIGKWVNVHLHKTKLTGNSGDVVKVPLMHNLGFSDAWAIFEESKKRNSIMESISTKRGWGIWELENGEEVKFQGWDGFLKHVVTHPEYGYLVDEFYGDWEEDDEE